VMINSQILHGAMELSFGKGSYVVNAVNPSCQ
jgi:hypothetical protein